MDFQDLKNKRVVIMGLGLYKEGSGVNAARFFASRGARVLVTDLRGVEMLAPSLKQFARFKHITYILGRHRKGDFKRADIVFQNPSVPDTSPFLAVARKAGALIVNDWTIFLAMTATADLLAVTGTRGKSTTATLLYDIVRRWKRGARLAGNIGVSPLAFLDAYRGESVVAELSSWLLRGFRPVRFAPAVAVVTNILRDHMDKYPSMKEYIADKSLIWRSQRRGQCVVLNRDNPGTRAMGKNVRGTRLWFSLKPFVGENGCFPRGGAVLFRRDGKDETVCRLTDWKLPGEHNLANLLAAVCAARAYGVPAKIIRKSVRVFRGVPSRLELVRTLRGVRFYNDTTATTPDAAIAALETLHATRPQRSRLRGGRAPYTLPPRIILIAGGADKKLEYEAWARVAKRSCKAIVFLPGAATEKMLRQVSRLRPAECGTTDGQAGVPPSSRRVRDYGRAGRCQILEARSMAEAVKLASDRSERGDIILLSPGAASFGLFKNEFDRGDQFLKAVKAAG